MLLSDHTIAILVTLTTISALASYVIGFGVLHLLRVWQVVDNPNARSSHKAPTPRGGGLGILAIFLAGAALTAWLTVSDMSWLVMVIAGLLAMVSFMDDRRPLPWWGRLGCQLFAALVVSMAMLRGFNLEEMGLGVLLLVLLVGYSNAFNFMDGINGLAAGQAAISAAGMASLGVLGGVPPGHPAVLLSVILAGAAAGFLPHNFPHARMFMGDVGSVPLGFVLMLLTAWLAQAGGQWLWIPLGALHVGFILDTGVTMLRRALRGAKLYEAHREHFYQRLVRAGRTHVTVTGMQIGMSVVVLTMLMVVTASRRELLPLAAATTTIGWIAYFVYCEREFTRHNKY